MKLNIQNEFGTLRSVVVCLGENIPVYEEYKTDDPEFTKYHQNSWDKDLLLEQQENFFTLLRKYKVELIFPRTEPQLIWQMYTRDTAFVIDQKIYYSPIRKLQARNGEIENIFSSLYLSNNQIAPIENQIEGGDVMVINKDYVYLGHGSRTAVGAIKLLEKHLKVKAFELGNNVMHLDTRLNVLPGNIALVNLNAFDRESLGYLHNTYNIIEVSDEETKKLGINVFVIGRELESQGLKVELIDYTEPINLGGSFRCTTLPIERK